MKCGPLCVCVRVRVRARARFFPLSWWLLCYLAFHLSVLWEAKFLILHFGSVQPEGPEDPLLVPEQRGEGKSTVVTVGPPSAQRLSVVK